MLTTESSSTIRLAARLSLVLGLLAAPVAAQKIGRDYFEDKRHGYKLKYPKDWSPVPVKPDAGERGISARIVSSNPPTSSMNASTMAPMTFKILIIMVLLPAYRIRGENRHSRQRLPFLCSKTTSVGTT